LGFWSNVSTRFVLQNVFGSVFEFPSPKNTRKRDKTKEVEEKLISIFFVVCRNFGERFSTWTFCKNIFMVFLNSPCRKTPKNVLKKKPDDGLVGLGFGKSSAVLDAPPQDAAPQMAQRTWWL
jgi:hypothetical protein